MPYSLAKSFILPSIATLGLDSTLASQMRAKMRKEYSKLSIKGHLAAEMAQIDEEVSCQIILEELIAQALIELASGEEKSIDGTFAVPASDDSGVVEATVSIRITKDTITDDEPATAKAFDPLNAEDGDSFRGVAVD